MSGMVALESNWGHEQWISSTLKANEVIVGHSYGFHDVPRPPSRRRCRHCITCAGLKYHQHSTTVASANLLPDYAEWWPAGMRSPTPYFTLRRSQLDYQILNKHSRQNWRKQEDILGTSPSALLTSRHRPSLTVSIPSTYTNVNAADHGQHIKLTSTQTIHIRHQQNATVIQRATTAHRRNLSETTTPMNVDSAKRSKVDSTTFTAFVGLAPPAVYPGVVLQPSTSAPIVATPPIFHGQPCTAKSDSDGSNCSFSAPSSVQSSDGGGLFIPIGTKEGMSSNEYVERQARLKAERAYHVVRAVEIPHSPPKQQQSWSEIFKGIADTLLGTNS